MIARTLGVDVAARRGCDVVALGDDLVARPVGCVHTADELRTLVAAHGPAVVAVDAPRAWSRDGEIRACERELMANGISMFRTPDEHRGAASAFYDWMRTGFEMFAGAAPTPTLEVYPHASAVAVLGAAPARGLLRDPAAKRAWRRAALDAAGIDHSALRTIDEVDAALCALTGLWFLDGRTVAFGDAVDGVLTVPVGLPDRATRTPSPRGSSPGARARRATG